MGQIYVKRALTAIGEEVAGCGGLSERLHIKELIMSYSERAYFEGEPCHHCVAWDEWLRLERKRVEAIRALDRRSSRR